MTVDPRAIESLLSFWNLAGVEALYADAPVDRTVASPPRTPAATRPTPARAAPVTAAPKPAPPVAAETASASVDAEAVAEARRAAAAADDLDTLKAAIAAFDGCALKSGARQAVFSRGPGDAPLMVIGEAPGADEDAQGAPFVGGASAKAMLKRPEGILSLRGRWLEWRSQDGALEIPALPTLHPAFLLRQPAAKRKSWEDMLLLAERLDRPARPH